MGRRHMHQPGNQADAREKNHKVNRVRIKDRRMYSGPIPRNYCLDLFIEIAPALSRSVEEEENAKCVLYSKALPVR